MYRRTVAASLALCLAALPALAAAPAGVLRGTDCLDPDLARSWIDIDSRTLLVDAGRRKYRIEVAPACTALGYSPVLGFKGDSISGRICGVLGDAIITRDYSCRIERMELLDKEQYKQALESRKSSRKQKPVSHSNTP
jgi:hypothetical protein